MTDHSSSPDADLALLLARYETPDTPDERRRPPWTWPALDRTERAGLARMIDIWVDSYNRVHATSEDDLLPPCWRQHPGLATELAVQVWHWYAIHTDPRATVAAAAEFYGRHLPGFRGRVDHMLGRSPGECRSGQHPSSWRKDVDDARAVHIAYPHDAARDDADVVLLGALHFGFPHLSGEEGQ